MSEGNSREAWLEEQKRLKSKLSFLINESRLPDEPDTEKKTKDKSKEKSEVKKETEITKPEAKGPPELTQKLRDKFEKRFSSEPGNTNQQTEPQTISEPIPVSETEIPPVTVPTNNLTEPQTVPQPTPVPIPVPVAESQPEIETPEQLPETQPTPEPIPVPVPESQPEIETPEQLPETQPTPEPVQVTEPETPHEAESNKNLVEPQTVPQPAPKPEYSPEPVSTNESQAIQDPITKPIAPTTQPTHQENYSSSPPEVPQENVHPQPIASPIEMAVQESNSDNSVNIQYGPPQLSLAQEIPSQKENLVQDPPKSQPQHPIPEEHTMDEISEQKQKIARIITQGFTIIQKMPDYINFQKEEDLLNRANEALGANKKLEADELAKQGTKQINMIYNQFISALKIIKITKKKILEAKSRGEQISMATKVFMQAKSSLKNNDFKNAVAYANLCERVLIKQSSNPEGQPL
jgi:hypothetical protein